MRRAIGIRQGATESRLWPWRVRFSVVLTASASVLLTACAPLGLEPWRSTPSATQSAAAPTATPDTELESFTAAIQGGTVADPDALVAALEDAGFERGAIERTREVDSLGAPVSYLEVAVSQGETCLVGQVGVGEPMALRMPALADGGCLVGDVVRP